MYLNFVAVKFVLMPSGQVVTQRCHLNQTLAELKSNFASELKIPSNILLLMFEGWYYLTEPKN